MTAHLRANLWLLILSVLLCCVLYPVILLVIGQTIFHDKAQGSLLTDASGKVIGSRLIAQPFTSDEYVQPRPSAASYNGAASGATNWGANNPALRKRVIGMLGPILKYRDGRPVGPDVVSWVRENLQKDPGILSKWVESNGDMPGQWAVADPKNTEAVTQYQASHADVVAAWKKDNPDAAEMPPAEVAKLLFASYASGEIKAWPETDGKDIQAVFFGPWWDAHSTADVQPVPADMVMASGSGLDPDITVDGAMYQLDRVAASWAGKTNRNVTEIRHEIENLIHDKAQAPLGGLAGVPLINVLEMNLALRDRFGK